MRVRSAAALAIGLGARAVLAADPTDPLVAAERAFAALSASSGMKTAFLANLADDAVIFRPGPVAARQDWQARPDPKATLLWAPEYGEISASGDLGFDYGPWDLKTPAGETHHGRFFSVWRRGPDGTLEVALDGGISGLPEQPFPADARRRALPAPAKAIHPGKALSSLERAASAWSRDAAGFGVLEAARRHASPDLVVLRDGSPPAEGRVASLALLARGAARFQGRHLFHAVSRAGDLAYAYGTGETIAEGDSGSVRAKAAFVQVWRRENGGWALAADVLLPYPAP